jgi:uncharacterized damage-inducible protein DinB
MDRTLIEQYAAGANLPAQALRGLSPEDLLATPVPGTWSIQQIVLHLMDSDLIAADRMKRIIAEDNPTIIGFDQAAFAAKLHYDKLDAAVAADIFRQNRLLMAVILRNLPDSAFARFGNHNERGPLTLAQMVAMYVGHLSHHMGFLNHKRQLLGKTIGK